MDSIIESTLFSPAGVTFVGFIFAAVVSFVLGVLVDRKIISKETKQSIKNIKQAALKEYVENAEKGIAKDIVNAYLGRDDVEIKDLDEEVKN